MLFGPAEIESRIQAPGVNIHVKLGEAVKEDQSVESLIAQPRGQVGERRKVPADFHRHRNFDLRLDRFENIQVELFGVTCRGAGGDDGHVDIEFDGIRTRGLELSCIAWPPFCGDTVDAGDDRNVDHFPGLLQHGTVLLRAVLLAQFRAHIVIGFRVPDGSGGQVPLFTGDGFLEKALHHHSRSAGLFAGADLFRRLGQPAAGDNDRILELKIHKAGLQVHLVPLLLVACSYAPVRAQAGITSDNGEYARLVSGFRSSRRCRSRCVLR